MMVEDTWLIVIIISKCSCGAAPRLQTDISGIPSTFTPPVNIYPPLVRNPGSERSGGRPQIWGYDIINLTYDVRKSKKIGRLRRPKFSLFEVQKRGFQRENCVYFPPETKFLEVILTSLTSGSKFFPTSATPTSTNPPQVSADFEPKGGGLLGIDLLIVFYLSLCR